MIPHDAEKRQPNRQRIVVIFPVDVGIGSQEFLQRWALGTMDVLLLNSSPLISYTSQEYGTEGFKRSRQIALYYVV